MSEITSVNNILVLIALGFAVFTDLKVKKVDNRFVVGIFIIGILAQIFVHGFSGIVLMASAFSTAVALGLPLYLMKVFGGGDFKLLLAVSTLLDWKAVIVVTLASLFWGAILGIFRVAFQGDIKSVFTNLLSVFLRNNAHIQKLHAMPFTVAILFGFLSHLTLSQVGWELL